jgi:hypothetical protein
MKIKNLISILVIALALTCLPGASGAMTMASAEGDVRTVVQQVFEQLKAGQYSSLYDSLPAASRGRLSRQQFDSMLQKTRSMYQLDRLEVGNVRVANNLAVVDTVMFGRVLRPITAEGKIVVQQYLVREDGRWRVATGDNQTIRRFLAANPAFGKSFALRPARVYMKQNGSWVLVNMSRLPKRT